MSTRTDEQLMEAARSGDDKALDEVLARHEKQVYRFGLRMCGSEEDAKEVLQETLLAAFRGLHAFRGWHAHCQPEPASANPSPSPMAPTRIT